MSRIGLLIIAVGLTILFVSNVAAQERQALGQSGHDIFMDRCSSCHGKDGKGNGPAARALKTAPGDLTLLTKKNRGVFAAERVRKIVGDWVDIDAHGSLEMPIWGGLFHPRNVVDQQIANLRIKNLVAYIESIQQ